MKKAISVLAVLFLLNVSAVFAAVVEDWSAVESGKNTGAFQDSNGSKIDFVTDVGPKGGKALKLTSNLVAGGYCGIYHNVSLDLSKSGSLKFMAKSTVPGDVQMAITDAFHVQYVAKFQVSSKDWTEINVSLSSFVKDPYYTPPDAIAGHSMDLSKTGNLNFSPQIAGASVIEIGPVETSGSATASSAAAASPAQASAAKSVVQEIKATGAGISVYDFSGGDEAKAGGTFQDSTGSSFKYVVKENPKKKGAMYITIDYELKQGGYCGMFHRTGSTWDGQNWTGAKAISFLIYCKQPMVLGLAFKDKNNNQYVATSPSSKGGNWEKIMVPIDSFKLDPYYTPPDAIKGGPEDLSAVKGVNIQAQTVGKFSLSIDAMTVVK